MNFRLLAGLGNPGLQYARTRHNVGFMVMDAFAARAEARFAFEKKWGAEIATQGALIFCKPATYMNLSGQAVAAVAHFYKIPPAELLIVFDDLALPLGKLRLRPSGSAGGHNGMDSVICHLGTDAVPRLRIGIGAAEGRGMVEHVLDRFSGEEMPVVESAVAQAVAAVEYAQANGLQAAMNQYN